MGIYRFRARPDGTSQFDYFSPRCADLLGVEASAVLQDSGHVYRAVHPDDLESLVRVGTEAVQSGERYAWEGRFIVRGTTPWIRAESWPHPEVGGDVVWHGVVTDFTGNKQVEEALRGQFAQIDAIYQSMPLGLCLLDTESRYVRVNQALAALNGMPVEHHIGRAVSEIVPALADTATAICRHVATTRQPVMNYEVTGQTPAQPGVMRTWTTHWSPVTLPDGGLIGINLIVQEITGQKRTENALRESEAKYRKLHESMTDAFVKVDMTGRITDFNPAYQALLGYSPEELRRLTYVDLTPSEWHAFESRIVAEQILPQGYSDVYEKQYRRKDGSLLDAELRTFLVRDDQGRPAGMWAIVRDITQRKQMEQALREARDQLEARVQERTAELKAANASLAENAARLQVAIDVASLGFYEVRDSSDSVFVDERLRRLLGIPKEWEGRPREFWAARVHPDDLERLVAERGVVLEGGKDNSLNEYRYRHPENGLRWLYHAARVLERDSQGRAVRVFGVSKDITEQKNAEQALRKSELRNRMILNTALDGFLTTDFQGNILEVNDAYCRMVGYTREEFLRMRLSDLDLNEPTEADVLKHIERIATLGWEKFEARQRCKDGRLIDLEVSVTCPGQDERRLYSFLRDITERVRLERQIMEIGDRAQANFGQEIHDGLCQMLVSAAFDAYSLRQRLAANAAAEEPMLNRLCQVLDEAITEGRRLAHGLFPVRLSDDGLAAALRDLVRSQGRHAGLRTRFAEDGGPVLIGDNASATHLFRIAQEALNNAVKHARARRLAVRLAQTPQFLILTVTDDGTGICAEARNGTGLGLHIMDYRARALGGALQICALPGGGTEVLCRVPLPLPRRSAPATEPDN